MENGLNKFLRTLAMVSGDLPNSIQGISIHRRRILINQSPINIQLKTHRR